MTFLEIARSRHSAREFDPSRPLTESEKESILEAGELAPSSRNIRPVCLIPVDDIDIIRSLASCKDSGTRALESATFAVVVAADARMSDVWIEDCSIASIMMQLEAEELGIGSCWIQVRLREGSGMPAVQRIRDTIFLGEGMDVLSIIAFGKQRSLPFLVQRMLHAQLVQAAADHDVDDILDRLRPGVEPGIGVQDGDAQPG